MFKLAPSILSADFANLGRDVIRIDKAGCDMIHVDVMDGMFVPNISFGMPVIKSIRNLTDKYFDVHLMIEEPIRYVEEFAKSGADMLTVHFEACKDVNETIDKIHEFGMDAAVAINPETDVKEVLPFIDKCEMILIMSVHPGFGGQSYIEECTDKLSVVKDEMIKKGYFLTDFLPSMGERIRDEKGARLLEVDGGVTLDNYRNPLNAGANILVAGSAVFKGDIEENIKRFKE